MRNSKHNPYSAPLGNKLPITPPPLSFSDTLVPWPLLLPGQWPQPGHWWCRDSSPNGVNRRAKNHEECKEPDSAPTSTCQLDRMAIGLIQGPLKSMQIFVLISVALDQHLCTQMKVSFFPQKGTKSCFPFIERRGALIPSSLLCSWDSPSRWCCASRSVVRVLADP